MVMKRFLSLSLILAIGILAGCQRQEKRLASPDGRIQCAVFLKNGRPYYSVTFEQKRVLLPSALGFKLKDAPDLLGPFEFTRVENSAFDEVWQPVWGTDKNIRNHYRQMRLTLRETKAPNRIMILTFRAFNDGVAFRYEFPRQPQLNALKIVSEETYFKLTGGTAWWIPGDYDSYEFLYRRTPLARCDSCATPFTVQTNNGLYLSLHEAALYDYAGMTLQRMPHDTTLFKSKLVPWPDGIKVKTQTPFHTPWRTILIAGNPGQLITSHLIQNLNAPCKIEDTSWIKPMKYVGIWWGMHIGKWTWYYGPRHGATTKHALQYIDFAAQHGIPGVLVEGWNKGWETWLRGKNVQDYLTPYPDFDLQRVVSYGKKKGVCLIGHHETGGNVPHYEKQMDAAFALYRRLGVPAVKTGYAGKMYPPGMHHHGQWMVRHYQRVVEHAARYHLMVDAHEPIKDTGISRTWPNFLTREGARGMEFNAWSEGNPPEHTLILPFTRFLAGPMDYTPGIFKLQFDSLDRHRVYTTLAKQLAYYVVLYSPLQMAADLVENYEGQPAFTFIEHVPVNWDTSLVLNGKIGDYLTIARRHAQRWYLGAITDEHKRFLTVPLGFLKKGQEYHAVVYGDAAQTHWRTNPTAIEIGNYRVTNADTLHIALSPSGGLAVEFVPVAAKEAAGLPALSVFNRKQKENFAAFPAVIPFREPPVKVKNLAAGKRLLLHGSFAEQYAAGGPRALIDGYLGNVKWWDHWQGFRATPLDAVIDLGREMPVKKISVGFLLKQANWIFLPVSVEFFVSEDGKKFTRIFSQTLPAAQKNEAWKRVEVGKEYSDLRTRYVKILAVPLKEIPKWHQGQGQPPWLFADEIVVQ